MDQKISIALQTCHQALMQYIWQDASFQSGIPQGLTIGQAKEPLENYHYQQLKSLLPDDLPRAIYVGLLLDLQAMAYSLNRQLLAHSAGLKSLYELTGQAQFLRLCDDLLKEANYFNTYDKGSLQEFYAVYRLCLSQMNDEAISSKYLKFLDQYKLDAELKVNKVQHKFNASYLVKVASYVAPIFMLFSGLVSRVEANSDLMPSNQTNLAIIDCHEFSAFDVIVASDSVIEQMLECYRPIVGDNKVDQLKDKSNMSQGLMELHLSAYPQTPFRKEVNEALDLLLTENCPSNQEWSEKYQLVTQEYKIVKKSSYNFSSASTLFEALMSVNLKKLRPSNDVQVIQALYQRAQKIKASDKTADLWCKYIASSDLDTFKKIHASRIVLIFILMQGKVYDLDLYFKNVVEEYNRIFNLNIGLTLKSNVNHFGREMTTDLSVITKMEELHLYYNNWMNFALHPVVGIGKTLFYRLQGLIGSWEMFLLAELYFELPDIYRDAVYSLEKGQLDLCGKQLQALPFDIKNYAQRKLWYAFYQTTKNYKAIFNLFEQVNAANVLQADDAGFLFFASQFAGTDAAKYQMMALRAVVRKKLYTYSEQAKSNLIFCGYNTKLHFAKTPISHKNSAQTLQWLIDSAVESKDIIAISEGLAKLPDYHSRYELIIGRVLTERERVDKNRLAWQFQAVDNALARKEWLYANEVIEKIQKQNPDYNNIDNYVVRLDPGNIHLLNEFAFVLTRFFHVSLFLNKPLLQARVEKTYQVILSKFEDAFAQINNQLSTISNSYTNITPDYIEYLRNYASYFSDYAGIKKDVERILHAIQNGSKADLLPEAYRCDYFPDDSNYEDLLLRKEKLVPHLKSLGIDTAKLYQDSFAWGTLAAALIGLGGTVYAVKNYFTSKKKHVVPVLRQQHKAVAPAEDKRSLAVDQLKSALVEQFSASLISISINDSRINRQLILIADSLPYDERVYLNKKFDSAIDEKQINIENLEIDQIESVIDQLKTLQAMLSDQLNNYREQKNIEKQRELELKHKKEQDLFNRVEEYWKLSAEQHILTDKVDHFVSLLNAWFIEDMPKEEKKKLLKHAIQLAIKDERGSEDLKHVLSEFRSLLESVLGINDMVEWLPRELRKIWHGMSSEMGKRSASEVSHKRVPKVFAASAKLSKASASKDAVSGNKPHESLASTAVPEKQAAEVIMAAKMGSASSSSSRSVSPSQRSISPKPRSVSPGPALRSTIEAVNSGSSKVKERSVSPSAVFSQIQIKQADRAYLSHLNFALHGLKPHVAHPFISLALQFVLLHAAYATHTPEGEAFRHQLAHGRFELPDPEKYLASFDFDISKDLKRFVKMLPQVNHEKPVLFDELQTLRTLAEMLRAPDANPKAHQDIALLACKMQLMRVDARLRELDFGEDNFHGYRNMLAHQRDTSLAVETAAQVDPRIFAAQAINSLAHKPVDVDDLLTQVDKILRAQTGEALIEPVMLRNTIWQ